MPQSQDRTRDPHPQPGKRPKMRGTTMATETTKQIAYGVARGDKLIHGGYSDVRNAVEQLALFTDQMHALGLEPDVRLVEYDVETIVKTGRVRAYREPVDDEPDSTETDTTDTDSTDKNTDETGE
jgi:hypothetical protein